VLVSAVFGSTASAGPIHRQNGNASNLGLPLTVEHLQILDARPDNGWHLGWFKNERGDVLPDATFPDGTLEAIAIRNGFTPGDVAAAASMRASEHTFAQRIRTAPDPSAQVTPVPEPATLVLFGSGLVAAVVARRREQQRRYQ
jgi:hypothetical protein